MQSLRIFHRHSGSCLRDGIQELHQLGFQPRSPNSGTKDPFEFEMCVGKVTNGWEKHSKDEWARIWWSKDYSIDSAGKEVDPTLWCNLGWCQRVPRPGWAASGLKPLETFRLRLSEVPLPNQFKWCFHEPKEGGDLQWWNQKLPITISLIWLVLYISRQRTSASFNFSNLPCFLHHFKHSKQAYRNFLFFSHLLLKCYNTNTK